jgi:hypothetical protein
MDSSYRRLFFGCGFLYYLHGAGCVCVWCADGTTRWMEVELWVC